MSINKHSKNTSQKVVSEYFTKNNVMDESSDFHDKKDFTNLKRLPKSSAVSKKRPAKKIKGQKDIRTALKSKKNELVSYSKEFDKVCKKSGIDIDSEQLQVAIALSKSLNDPEDLPHSSCSSESLIINDNCNKIRTTLQEYGFTVPEIKIGKNQNKRPKKHRKQYKLLATNEIDKKQIILDRYAQIISESVDLNAISAVELNQNCTETNLQHLATNASYDCIRDIEIFYVKGLLQISPNSIGSLLKDWATIPGRPASPTLDPTPNFKFKDLNCTLTDLDTILSGTVEIAQSLISRISKDSVETDIKIEDKTLESINMKVIDKEANDTLSIVHTERSCSPDIFDDDLSIDKSYNNTFSEATIKENNAMDLTECVPIKTNATSNKTVLSQCSDVTKRKSNDFMEMTNCIASSSQPIRVNDHHFINKEHYSQEKQYCEVIDDRNDKTKTKDLSQHSFVQENTVDKDKPVSLENVDLTQSSDSCELPDINLGGAQKDHEKTIILDESEYTGSKTPRKAASTDNDIVTVNDLGPKDIVTLYSDVDEILDLTSEIQKSPNSSKENEVNLEASTNGSLVSNATLNKEVINNEADVDLTQTNEDIYDTDGKSAQVSYSSLGKYDNMSLDYDEVINIDNCETDTNNTENVEKPNSQSVFVDVIDNVKEECSEASSNKLDSSQASEIFEIYDNELDYSIQQSRLEMPSEHFDLGGLSILDNVSTNSSNYKHVSKIKSAELNKFALNDNREFDPVSKITSVELAKSAAENNRKVHKVLNSSDVNEDKPSTPSKAEVKIAIQTPRTDYIIKTDQVTPIPDYTAMDTPGRNKELDKYGLKPFKRKRAIQLLTHLYNQTHPLIENISQEDLPSPSKKLRTEPIQNTNSIKKSPRKTLESPNKKSPKVQRDKGQNCENLYEISNESPSVKDIVCDPEDYVFQKREKLKVHSCKVPLHIVFYNYVSCRSELKEAILRYEPVNIDDIHKDLAAMGYRFDPKDLLKFLDKKCITVKTADNNSRNHRK